MEIIIIASVLYWTFMIATIAILANQVNNARDVIWTIGVATVWPVFAVVVAVALPYLALVASTKRIRTDLHNRKLLREFDDWIRERNAGKKQ